MSPLPSDAVPTPNATPPGVVEHPDDPQWFKDTIEQAARARWDAECGGGGARLWDDVPTMPGHLAAFEEERNDERALQRVSLLSALPAIRHAIAKPIAHAHDSVIGSIGRAIDRGRQEGLATAHSVVIKFGKGLA